MEPYHACARCKTGRERAYLDISLHRYGLTSLRFFEAVGRIREHEIVSAEWHGGKIVRVNDSGRPLRVTPVSCT